MKTIRIFLLFVVVSMAIGACEKDNFGTPPIDPNKIVSFSNDLIPLFAANCAKSGCHVTGSQTPDLTAANAYDQLTGLGYVPTDKTGAETCKLYVRMTSFSNPMPKSGILPAAQSNLVLSWIRQGAQNN